MERKEADDANSSAPPPPPVAAAVAAAVAAVGGGLFRLGGQPVASSRISRSNRIIRPE